MILLSLPPIQQTPVEEQTDIFQLNLNAARISNHDYRQKLDELSLEDNPNSVKEQQLERELRNSVRQQLGLPVRTEKDSISLAEWAKQNDISPSFELPFPDPQGEDLEKHLDMKIQTLLLPDQMERKMSGLYHQTQSGLAETGINTLFCSWGYLEWYESENSDKPFFAPLILLPLEMKRILARQTWQYSVQSIGDEAEINTTLQERLRRDFGLELPRFQDEDTQGEDTPESYFREISEVIKDKPRWRIHRFVAIGLFYFNRLVMYHDLDPSRWPSNRSLNKHEVLSDLLAGKEYGDTIDTEDYSVDRKDISAQVPILITDADSSQFSAIVDVMKGKNLAIKGPPGTGKSQTITNIIASALFENKKILFLSEKMAALEVVKKRLDDAGIGDFCLELHSSKARKKDVLASLLKRLEMQTILPGYYVPLVEEIEKLRDQLNEYSSKINQIYGNTGKTINQIIWAEANSRERAIEYGLPEDLKLLTFESANQKNNLDLDEARSKLSTIEELYDAIIRKYEYVEKHPWYGIDIRNVSSFDHEKIVREYQNWLSILKHIEELASDLSRIAEINDASMSIDSLKKLVWEIKEQLPIKESETDSNLISKLINNHTTRVVDRLLNDCDDYYEKCEELSEYLDDPEAALCKDVSQVDEFTKYANRLVFLEPFKSLRISQISELKHLLKSNSEAFKKYKQLAEEWLEFAGTEGPLTLVDMKKLITAIQLLNSVPRGVLIRRTQELMAELSEDVLARGNNIADQCITTKTGLEKRFIVRIEEDPQRIRQLSSIIRTAGFLGRLGNAYRNAVSEYRSLLRNVEPKSSQLLMASDLGAIADNLEEAQRLRADDQLRSICGSEFRGIETDFSILRAVNKFGIDVRQNFKSNSSLDKGLRKLLMEESTEILYAIEDTVDESNINDFMYYVDTFSSHDLNITPDSICKDYEDIMVLADSLQTITTAMTVKNNIIIEELPSIIDKAQELSQINSDVSDNSEAKSVLGDIFQGVASSTEIIRSTNNMAEAILSANFPGKCTSKLLCKEFHQTYEKLSSIIKGVEECVLKEAHIRENSDYLKRINLDLLFGIFESEKISVSDLTKLLETAVDNSNALFEWADYCRAKQDAVELGLGQVLDLYSALEKPPDHLKLPDAFDWVFYRSILKSVYDDFPEFKQFSGLTHEAIRKRYRKLDREIIVAQRLKLARKLFTNPISRGVSTGAKKKWSDRSLIENEVRKEKRHIPLRDLITRASMAILDMKPCFMMSPASVAKYIPPDSRIEFDIVIIDEASQMKPEEAVGAIVRGKQLIVVGDPKQLPPTSFFERTEHTEEEDEDEEDLIDTESILDSALFTFRPSRNLKWHYRSRHESLIAFSNKEFYDNELILFPSSTSKHPDLGVEYKFVNGQYRNSINVPEAEEVIKAAREFMHKNPNRSLGIATMNLKQREILNDQLDLLFATDRKAEAYRQRWEPTLEPIFVKNLENVQGDERDVIFISTTYGSHETGKVPQQRFGPINNNGGHRRLNVLFTRAKEQIVVFSSMKSTDIIPTEASKEGVWIFKRYLEYARTGQLESGTTSGREPESDFEVFVSERLRRCGYQVVPQVGVAGFFIDLAVKDPNNPDSYLAGIECDGATYHLAKSARDRDRLRQEVLEGHRWNIYRIWSTDWFADPDREMQKLLDYLHGLAVSPYKIIRAEQQDGTINETSEDQQAVYEEEPEIQFELHSPIATDSSISEFPSVEQEIPSSDIASILLDRVKKQMKPYNGWTHRSLPKLHDSSQSEVSKHIMDIISIEEPIICHRIYRIYAFNAGYKTISQVRSPLNKMIHRVFTEGIIKQSDDFDLSDQLHKVVRMQGSPPVIVRTRGGRPIAEIPPSEIAALMHLIVKSDTSVKYVDQDTLFSLVLYCYEAPGPPSHTILPTLSTAWDIYCATDE